MSITFGKWLPDYGPQVDGLMECKNLLPINGKYMPLQGLSTLCTTPMTGTPLTVFGARTPSRVNKIFLADTTHIYRKDGNALVDVSRDAGYSLASLDTFWSTTGYGGVLIMTNGIDPIQSMSDFDSTAKFTDLGGNPPKAKHVCLFKDQLILGNTIENGTSYPRRIFRSAIGNIEDWNVSSATGCGYYDLPAWGEEVVGLAASDNYLIVYMTNSIWILDQIGAPLWYSYDKIFEGPGLISPGAIIKADNMTHYIMTKDDLYSLSGRTVSSIGFGVRTYLQGDLNPSYRTRITGAVSYAQKLLYWSYPSRDSKGIPDKLLIFNIEEGKFTWGSLPTYCLGKAFGESTTIDELDQFGTIDSLTSSFDSSYFKSSEMVIGVDPTINQLSFLGGIALDSTLRTGEIDLETVSTVSGIRPNIVNPNGTVKGTVYTRNHQLSRYATQTSPLRPDGLIDFRTTGRYLQFEISITGNHEGLSGFAPELVKRGKR